MTQRDEHAPCTGYFLLLLLLAGGARRGFGQAISSDGCFIRFQWKRRARCQHSLVSDSSVNLWERPKLEAAAQDVN